MAMCLAQKFFLEPVFKFAYKCVPYSWSPVCGHLLPERTHFWVTLSIAWFGVKTLSTSQGAELLGPTFAGWILVIAACFWATRQDGDGIDELAIADRNPGVRGATSAWVSWAQTGDSRINPKQLWQWRTLLYYSVANSAPWRDDAYGATRDHRVIWLRLVSEPIHQRNG